MEKEKLTTNKVNSNIDINATTFKKIVKSITTIDEYDINSNVIKHVETKKYYSDSTFPYTIFSHPSTTINPYNPLNPYVTYYTDACCNENETKRTN